MQGSEGDAAKGAGATVGCFEGGTTILPTTASFFSEAKVFVPPLSSPPSFASGGGGGLDGAVKARADLTNEDEDSNLV